MRIATTMAETRAEYKARLLKDHTLEDILEIYLDVLEDLGEFDE